MSTVNVHRAICLRDVRQPRCAWVEPHSSALRVNDDYAVQVPQEVHSV